MYIYILYIYIFTYTVAIHVFNRATEFIYPEARLYPPMFSRSRAKRAKLGEACAS